MKSPFPWFGGKSQISALAWELFGEVENYVEPFAGSLAVLLGRPAPVRGPETVNDLDCFVVNAWRAMRDCPGEVADRLVAPVCEVETEAQHAALMRMRDGIRDALGDPAWCDPVAAAWWIKGANEWIGSGWCSGEGPWSWSADCGWINRKLPHLGDAGRGINRQLPHLGDAGTGINRQLPNLGNAGTGRYSERLAWIGGWMQALRDRLCTVRIACGDWTRVLGESCTVKHGTTAVFLDPPYDGTEYVYGEISPVSEDVREWCIASGDDRRLRIILAGRGEEHDALLPLGWSKRVWSARKGYASHDERETEALWCSPGCKWDEQPTLFENL